VTTELVHGLNAVLETLRADRRRVHEVYLHGASPVKDEIRRLAASRSIPLLDVDGRWMASRFPSREDQGAAASVSPYPYVDLDELLEATLLLALDQVQDPRNLGAIARSASAFSTSLIIHKDRSAQVTPAAVRASAGMTEHLAIARVTNLARALDSARAAGIWIRGLDASSPTAIHSEDLTLPTLLVVGGEDSGLRRLTSSKCDSLLSIPIAPPCTSLNAATAAAIALAEASRQRLDPDRRGG
jgi:23S rRNA (guanosine2251-2'-O)-methyltransferase